MSYIALLDGERSRRQVYTLGGNKVDLVLRMNKGVNGVSV